MSISLNSDSPGLNCLSSEGYHHNSVSVAKLLSSGCTQCYMADYRESTKTADIMSCLGPILFVGSKSTRSLTFLHGSYGPVAIVKASQPTITSKIHNGVHWHFEENTSFGFSYDLQSISNGEIGTIGTIGTDKGVSWKLDAEVATAGTTSYKKNLNMRNIFNLMPSRFEKHIYNCPDVLDTANNVENEIVVRHSWSESFIAKVTLWFHTKRKKCCDWIFIKLKSLPISSYFINKFRDLIEKKIEDKNDELNRNTKTETDRKSEREREREREGKRGRERGREREGASDTTLPSTRTDETKEWSPILLAAGNFLFKNTDTSSTSSSPSTSTSTGNKEKLLYIQNSAKEKQKDKENDEEKGKEKDKGKENGEGREIGKEDVKDDEETLSIDKDANLQLSSTLELANIDKSIKSINRHRIITSATIPLDNRKDKDNSETDENKKNKDNSGTDENRKDKDNSETDENRKNKDNSETDENRKDKDNSETDENRKDKDNSETDENRKDKDNSETDENRKDKDNSDKDENRANEINHYRLGQEQKQKHGHLQGHNSNKNYHDDADDQARKTGGSIIPILSKYPHPHPHAPLPIYPKSGMSVAAADEIINHEQHSSSADNRLKTKNTMTQTDTNTQTNTQTNTRIEKEKERGRATPELFASQSPSEFIITPQDQSPYPTNIEAYTGRSLIGQIYASFIIALFMILLLFYLINMRP